MDERFKKAYSQLNNKQRQAVDTIDGPLLVIAGPGTGKTQLLSTRIGHILKTTDTLPSEILCLTFTEAAAGEMRERLIDLIGQEAYSINISTYHAFGAEIMRRNPEYFEDADLQAAEELRSHLILTDIIARLPYSNPLKFADTYLRDVADFISDCKQALLSPDDIEAIAHANLDFIDQLNRLAKEPLAKITRISAKVVPAINELASIIRNNPPAAKHAEVLPLGRYCLDELESALADFEASGKTPALRDWKKKWLEKDSDGSFIIGGKRQNQRLLAAGSIYRDYAEAMADSYLYDYDDMVLRAIVALEKNSQFRYSLAENYQYILLDEFQDTNRAQMRLVELLTDHPVHEGRPNVMAVGDDDQAIYAFQGADHANMAYFANFYKETIVISLEENYRSHADIVQVSQAVVEQIENRLQDSIPGVNKILVAANRDLPKQPSISVTEFKSDAAQYEWVAEQIQLLVDKEKIPPSEIAVLAPKHRYLIPLLPCLLERKLPVKYEKRENILDAPLVRQLEQMSRLILALNNNELLAGELWPEVISYDFWQLPTDKIWRIGWNVRHGSRSWTDTLLSDKSTKPIAGLFLRLKDLSPLTSLEEMLDVMIGVPETSKKLKVAPLSPFFEYYFGKTGRAEPAEFTRLLSHLNKLREGLREWQHGQPAILKLEDMVRFIEGHRAAKLNILDQSPYYESAEAINLLTAYGAKGREFKAVFIVAANDDVWGSSSRNQGSRLSLPSNLSYIRYQGASEDERLRLLFVAITRAKTHLYFTSYSQTLAGKSVTRLKYLNFSEQDRVLTCGVFPDSYSKVMLDNNTALPQKAAEHYWAQRHIPPFRQSLKSALKGQLDRYQLSATHLNQFTDIVDNGPNLFFLQSILGFQSAPTITSIYGTAVHNTLRWLGGVISKDGRRPEDGQVIDYFLRQLRQFRLSADDYEIQSERGRASLGIWLEQSASGLAKNDKYEHDFADEAVFIDKTHLAGKIDRLAIDKKTKQIEVIDYKTGQAYERWEKGVLKLHKFRQQLMVYKLLVENSASFKGYEVSQGTIEFVEPNEHGRIVRLPLKYDAAELEDTKQLISAVWSRIKSLDFPDTGHYPKTLAGIRAFENYLRGEQ